MRRRPPAAAHSMTCWDSLALGRKVAADVCSVGDEHGTAGRNQNAVP